MTVTAPLRLPSVLVRDVGPRDGLQAEDPVDLDARVRLIDGLAGAGVSNIEAVSFVSPKVVPQMADPERVMAAIERRPDVVYWGLVPNPRGAELAVEAGMDALTVTISACPVYNKRNVRRTIDESVAGIADIVAVAGDRPVDAVISCVFGSPYTGDEPAALVPSLIERLRDQGVHRFTLADTTGMATPRRVESALASTGTNVGLHLHDTRGTALVNAWHAFGLGVRRFDTALGGLGGSPFAKGAGGNLATEDLVHLLDDSSILTGIDLAKLLELTGPLAAAVGHDLPGRIAAHGPRWATG
jgi:hydroxymethylglutaryl-CoA lyase